MKRLYFTAIAALCIVWMLSLNSFAFSVPDTGQTKCYSNNVEIPCPQPGEPFYGQDAQYGTNTQSYTKLDESGNALHDDAPTWFMVRDNVTGLIWEEKHNKDGVKNYADPNDADNTYTWFDGATGTPGNGTDTQDFINGLNTQNYGGHHDWRLPTIKELSTLVDSSIFQPGPTINTGYFPHTAVVYWSSTAVATYPAAWSVVFMAGDVEVLPTSYGSNQSYGGYVRAVRGGQTTNNFVDNNDDTITDTDTGLMWQKATAPGIETGICPTGYTWEQALTYCEDLVLAGYRDWRLPNRNELQSIVDYSRSNPATTFPDQPFPPPLFYTGVYIPYWSSTTYTTRPDYTGVAGSAWVVDFAQGNVAPGGVKYLCAYVRAVRGGRSWPCPAKTALGEQSRELQALRTFRDRFMKRSDQGREYAELYYQHAPEISSLLEANPKLKGESRRLILKLLPTVQVLLVQKKGIMEAGTVTQVTALLDNLSALGSPSLSADLVQLKKEMQSGRLFEELNISVAGEGIHPRLK